MTTGTPPLIYLDNAATSHPKAPGVCEAMVDYLQRVDANPGRSAHRRSIDAGRVIHATREAVARLVGIDDPLRVTFGHNATEALNLALHGLLRAGDHVIASSIEHNSVMRPLRTLEARGITVTIIPCESDGGCDPAAIERAIRPETTLIVLNHASNVIGTLLPIAEVGEIARRHDLTFLVDAAQTAGSTRIDMVGQKIDLLAFTGHKSLYGPTGTGGLVFGERVDPTAVHPLKQGGTGSRSELEEQPDFLPDAFEAGTANTVGLAGLEAGIRWVLDRGIEKVRDEQIRIVQGMIDSLGSIAGVTVYGTHRAQLQAAPVSFNIAGLQPSEVGKRLDRDHGILCRVGLHCSPATHRTIGTFPGGTIRFAPGVFTREEEVDRAVDAVARIASEVR